MRVIMLSVRGHVIFNLNDSRDSSQSMRHQTINGNDAETRSLNLLSLHCSARLLWWINHELHFTPATASLPPFRGANSISDRGKLHISRRGGGGSGSGNGGGGVLGLQREGSGGARAAALLPSSSKAAAENREGCQPCDASRWGVGESVSQSVQLLGSA